MNFFEEKQDEEITSEQSERDSEQSDWGAADNLALAVDSGAPVVSESGAEFNLGTVITPAISATFSILAPAWEVTDSECEALGKVWGDCFSLWFPDAQLSPKYAVLGTAVLTTAMVVAPRLKTPMKKIEKEVNEAA